MHMAASQFGQAVRFARRRRRIVLDRLGIVSRHPFPEFITLSEPVSREART